MLYIIIGFLDGWATNQHCLERQKDFKGNHPGEYKAIMFSTLKGLHEAIMNDVVSAPEILHPSVLNSSSASHDN